MRDLDARDKVRHWGIWALIAGPLGASIAAYSGMRLARMDAPWATGDALWLGLFIGVLFVGMSGMALWNWLFARALTPEEERLREMVHDWEQRRARFTGGGTTANARLPEAPRPTVADAPHMRPWSWIALPILAGIFVLMWFAQERRAGQPRQQPCPAGQMTIPSTGYGPPGCAIGGGPRP